MKRAQMKRVALCVEIAAVVASMVNERRSMDLAHERYAQDRVCEG